MRISSLRTKLININTLRGNKIPNDDQYVYIGRAGCGNAGFFGNYQTNLGDSRSIAVAKHRSWAQREYRTNPEFKAAVDGLYGKTLVCFCHPKPCHGEVLVELAEASRSPLFGE